MIEAPAQVTVSDLPLQTQSGNPLIRWALFLFCVAVVCPIRYYAESYGVDISWVQAMNLAAWKGLAVGRDIIWTTGPLSHLVFPLDIGSNLTEALRFQYAIWLLMGAVLADVFFSSGARVRNLALFSLYLAFSAPLYWFNFVGLDGLLTTGVLLLLTMVFLSGGTTRYVAALILTGLLPMVKLTAGMITGGAIAGFVAHRFLTKHAERWHALVLAAAVPTVTMAGMSWLLLPSIDAAKTYVLASLEVARNYSSAMATVGDAIEIAGAAQTLAWISVVLFIVWRGDSSKGRFAALLLGLPLLVSFKHGFVRQDMHVIIYFCFAAVVLAILSLLLPDSRKPFYNATLVVFAYTVTWAGYATLRVGPDAYWQSAGIQGLQLAAKTTDVTALRRHLARRSDREYPAELALDPEIRGAIGSQSVAILSVAFHRDMMRHLNVELYPVIQRYSAYSPYLDEWNARWIREKGPRFLLFDGSAIDDRHLWTETPAMWLEIYRHYNTRLSKTRNLLLERRTAPRFNKLVPSGTAETSLQSTVDMSSLAPNTFWSMHCPTTALGSVRKVLFRIPEVRMNLDQHRFRILPEVMTSPSPGPALPGTLDEVAALLSTEHAPAAINRRIAFSGDGASSYGVCRITYWTPDRQP